MYFVSLEEIEQYLIALEQADDNIIGGGSIASVASVDDLDISTMSTGNNLKVRMLSRNSMYGVDTNTPLLYVATYGQHDKNGNNNIQKALIKIHCWVGGTNVKRVVFFTQKAGNKI